MSDTMADRAWLAYHSLPRGTDGMPPAQYILEKEQGLGRGTLSRLFSGRRANYEMGTFAAICAALGVSAEYLAHGTGYAPTPTGVVPPRRTAAGLVSVTPVARPLREHDDWPAAEREATRRAKADSKPPVEWIARVGDMRIGPEPARLTAALILHLAEVVPHLART